MDSSSNYTEQSYKLSKLILFLLTFAAFAIMVNSNAELSRYLFGFPIIVSGILGIVGTYILYKGRHEPINEKKVIAVIVNAAMVILILTILISNTLYRL
ncbi:MAG: hypothetical protein HKP23_03120 [Flavobacteriaceae bacterium]|nr:hypothetical protein [Eudoraea sp.]NNJ38214.1 hypothetical protein [Flavobacteriaceae bacterium]